MNNEIVSDAIRAELDKARPGREASSNARSYAEGRQHAARAIARHIAAYAEQSDKTFNYAAFLKDCGAY